MRHGIELAFDPIITVNSDTMAERAPGKRVDR